MTVIEMPEWVMNELNKIVCEFIWEGKGVKIAQKTLVGKWWEGGLNLMDLEIKRTAIRIKTVRKYTVGRWNYGWKEFLKKYIEEAGGIGELIVYGLQKVNDGGNPRNIQGGVGGVEEVSA